MKTLPDFGDILVASWKLANPNRHMPISGTLDLALRALIREGGMPDWVRDGLVFKQEGESVRCTQMRRVLHCIESNGKAVSPTQDRRFFRITMDPQTCLRVLQQNNVDEDQARRWGRQLAEMTGASLRPLTQHRATEYVI